MWGGSSPAEDSAVVPDNQSADQKQERNDSNLTRRNSDGSSKKQPRSRKISDTKIAEELPITTTTTSNTLASNIVNTSSAVPGTSLNTPEPLNNDVDISTDETKGSDLIFNFEILGWNIYEIYWKVVSITFQCYAFHMFCRSKIGIQCLSRYV